MIARRVEPELLDALPADNPDAVRSRRDLRIINCWMANARHLTAAIRAIPFPIRNVLELGSGEGHEQPG